MMVDRADVLFAVSMAVGELRKNDLPLSKNTIAELASEYGYRFGVVKGDAIMLLRSGLGEYLNCID